MIAYRRNLSDILTSTKLIDDGKETMKRQTYTTIPDNQLRNLYAITHGDH